MVLIGRRDLRSNNSWMHNAPVLVKGKARCTMLRASERRRRASAWPTARWRAVRSRAGAHRPCRSRSTDAIMPGVVSIPHGWGHDLPGIQLGVASAHAGVNCNRLVDEHGLDPLSGNAVLNGVPVTVEALQ